MTISPARLWFAAMALGGFASGLIAERRPFGDDLLAHPLIAFFILAGIALLLLRIALQRPVPEIIPDRALVLGCFLGLGMFLVGNWLDVHILARP